MSLNSAQRLVAARALIGAAVDMPRDAESELQQIIEQPDIYRCLRDQLRAARERVQDVSTSAWQDGERALRVVSDRLMR